MRFEGAEDEEEELMENGIIESMKNGNYISKNGKIEIIDGRC